MTDTLFTKANDLIDTARRDIKMFLIDNQDIDINITLDGDVWNVKDPLTGKLITKFVRLTTDIDAVNLITDDGLVMDTDLLDGLWVLKAHNILSRKFGF